MDIDINLRQEYNTDMKIKMIYLFRLYMAGLVMMISHVSILAQPAVDTIKIPVDDHIMYGIHYPGAGDKTKTSVLLLHGFPGAFDDVLSLGSALSQDSINVFTLTLSGVSISEGVYGDSSPIVDLRAALDYFFESENLLKYQIDPNDFIIGGWSFGGGLAMYAGANDERVSRIISIAGFNGDAFLNKCAENEDFKNFMLAIFASYKFRGMVDFIPKNLISDLERHRDKFSPVLFANKIAAKPLLLFGCTDDAEVNLTDHILPYYYAIRSKRAKVKFHVYQTGHRFGGHRDRLAQDVLDWLLK